MLPSLVHRPSASFRVFHHLHGLLLQEAFFIGFGSEGDTMWLAVMVLVEIGERGKAVGGHFLRFAAAVHFGVDRQSAAPHMDDLAFEGDDVARENREFEIDAMQHEEDSVFGVNILCHGEIGAFQKPFGASAREEGLMMVEVGEFDESL